MIIYFLMIIYFKLMVIHIGVITLLHKCWAVGEYRKE